MIDQSYRQELRADTSQIVFPLVIVFNLFACLVGILASDGVSESWPFFLYAVAGPGATIVAARLINREKQSQGALIFIAAHLVLLTLVLLHPTSIASIGTTAFIYAIIITISSMILRPISGLHTWLASVALLLLGLVITNNWSWPTVLNVLPAIVINFVLAVTAFLTAVEWQTAVETTSQLHQRVQQRRDDLFAVQEELSLTNARLSYLNDQLDKARQSAENERDMRTRFMNNVSHELRTPLNAIVNFAHILTLGGRGPVSDGQVDYLNRIEQSGWHLLNVLNDLLDMAQIESGEFKLHVETIHLYHVCEEAMSSTRGLLLDKQVELIRDYPAEWPLVRVDQMRLKQAFINLLGNAAKYTEQGYIALRVQPNGSQVRIIVEDSGIGIAPEHHQAVFKEFHQVDETAARRRIGTGLGLPITRHLIERHGGVISLESEVGAGSKFIIDLPTYQPETVN
jgi:signal transduction histidine kinase